MIDGEAVVRARVTGQRQHAARERDRRQHGAALEIFERRTEGEARGGRGGEPRQQRLDVGRGVDAVNLGSVSGAGDGGKNLPAGDPRLVADGDHAGADPRREYDFIFRSLKFSPGSLWPSREQHHPPNPRDVWGPQ